MPGNGGFIQTTDQWSTICSNCSSAAGGGVGEGWGRGEVGVLLQLEVLVGLLQLCCMVLVQ